MKILHYTSSLVLVSNSFTCHPDSTHCVATLTSTRGDVNKRPDFRRLKGANTMLAAELTKYQVSIPTNSLFFVRIAKKVSLLVVHFVLECPPLRKMLLLYAKCEKKGFISRTYAYIDFFLPEIWAYFPDDSVIGGFKSLQILSICETGEKIRVEKQFLRGFGSFFYAESELSYEDWNFTTYANRKFNVF